MFDQETPAFPEETLPIVQRIEALDNIPKVSLVRYSGLVQPWL